MTREEAVNVLEELISDAGNEGAPDFFLRECNEALNTLKQPVSPGWRPIESAPKDGTLYTSTDTWTTWICMFTAVGNTYTQGPQLRGG